MVRPNLKQPLKNGIIYENEHSFCLQHCRLGLGTEVPPIVFFASCLFQSFVGKSSHLSQLPYDVNDSPYAGPVSSGWNRTRNGAFWDLELNGKWMLETVSFQKMGCR